VEAIVGLPYMLESILIKMVWLIKQTMRFLKSEVLELTIITSTQHLVKDLSIMDIGLIIIHEIGCGRMVDMKLIHSI